VHDANLRTAAIANRNHHRTRYVLTAQRTHIGTQRNVHRIAALMLRPRAMRRAPQMRRYGLAPGARPRTTGSAHDHWSRADDRPTTPQVTKTLARASNRNDLPPLGSLKSLTPALL